MPILPIARIAESITYVESMRTWGSNPPPATPPIPHRCTKEESERLRFCLWSAASNKKKQVLDTFDQRGCS